MNIDAVRRPPPDDPDPTDRLPELEEPSAGADPLENTGRWTAETADTGRKELEERDAAIADLTSALRQKSFALARAEKELEHSRSELLQARQAAGADRGLAERLQQVERDRAELALQRDQQLAAIGHLEDQLSELRESGQSLEQRSAQLQAALDEAQAACGELVGRLAETEDLLAAERGARRQLEDRLAASGQPAAPAAQRCLMRLDDGSSDSYQLSQPLISIGRTPDNDLQLRESYISRRHAVLKLSPGHVVIEDLHSRNGVFVNDRRISRELLHDGDTVTFGKARFRFRLLVADPPD